MRTQLLEDIGRSASLAPTPSNTVGNSQAGKAVQHLAPARTARPARPRAALGVWRQRPADAPPLPTPQAPDPAPPAPALHKVFDEMAALEAQFVPPAQQHAPAIAPFEAAASPEPLFDFTPPPPALQAAEPFTRAGSARPRQRYLLWGACLLAGALLIQGGRWWYQERDDAGSLALIAAAAKDKPQAGNAAPRQALVARELPGQPVDEVQATPPAPVPPLVMLPPEPPAAKPQPRPAAAAERAARPKARKPEPAAKPRAASPAPKRSNRPARVQSDAATEAATKQARRAPARQLARAPAVRTKRPAVPETTREARLRACRERGYHATQCIKRGCSVTEHGFACRTR